MSSSRTDQHKTRIMGEIGSPVTRAFLSLFEERLRVIHRKMESAEGDELYRLQGRCNELRELLNGFKQQTEAKFTGKHGSYF